MQESDRTATSLTCHKPLLIAQLTARHFLRHPELEFASPQRLHNMRRGFAMAVSCGLVGNSAWGRSMKNTKAIKARWRKHRAKQQREAT